MPEAHGAVHGNAEKQVAYRLAQRGFTRLVRTDDHMEITLCLREVQPLIRETSISLKFDHVESHVRFPSPGASARRRWHRSEGPSVRLCVVPRMPAPAQPAHTATCRAAAANLAADLAQIPDPQRLPPAAPR